VRPQRLWFTQYNQRHSVPGSSSSSDGNISVGSSATGISVAGSYKPPPSQPRTVLTVRTSRTHLTYPRVRVGLLLLRDVPVQCALPHGSSPAWPQQRLTSCPLLLLCLPQHVTAPRHRPRVWAEEHDERRMHERHAARRPLPHKHPQLAWPR
jgi:hypothetical protein